MIGSFLSHSLGLTDQVRQTGLSQPHPVAIDGVAVGDQDARPVLDKLLERLLGSPGMDYEQRRSGTGHNPKPNQLCFATSGCLINVRNRHTPHDLGNALVMELECVRNAINDSLYPALADG